MIETLEKSIQILLGINLVFSFVLLGLCLLQKKDINSWQFPMTLALFLDAIFVFTVLIKRPRFTLENKEQKKGRSPHHPY